MLDNTSSFDQNVLSAHQVLIEEIIEFISRKNFLSREIKDDFASEVFIKLLKNDGEVIRKFKGNSSLRTFLTVVINRIFLDYRDHHWGRWRPSTLAKRLGPTAILCEQYMHRDGHSFHETSHFLRHNHQLNLSEKDLRNIVHQLPIRMRKKKVSDEVLEHVPTQETRPDDTLITAEEQSKTQKAKQTLQKCLCKLKEQERLILRLRFERNLPLSQIAKSLNLNQKALYRLLPKILKQLRHLLKEQGIHAKDVESLIL